MHPTSALTRPRNVILVLLDSLNRHLLGAYGGRDYETPNIDRFCAQSLRFDRHYAGSLPCMPARHDLLCGSMDFLWRPWGSIEAWEEPITASLRHEGVVTQLISDHPHLFETGGENYHCDFNGWDYVRGHESDAWKTAKNRSAVGAPVHEVLAPRFPREYDINRTWFESEEDFPGPKTMSAAAQWVDENAGQHERFFLMIDEFDPHEPFDTPEPWASKYRDNTGKPMRVWPPYAKDVVKDGLLTVEQAQEVRDNYGAKLSMIDHWFGRLLEAIDRNELANDTAMILCTDHGHFLGEHDVFGKPAVPLYQPILHIPLMIRWPGFGPGRRDTLTTSVDLHATLCDIFGIHPRHRTHGRSLLPAIADPVHEVRDHLLAGIWGREVHYIDREHKYVRAPAKANAPISMWSNRWSSMMLHGLPQSRLLPPDRRAQIDFMPGSDVPVLRQPFVEGDMLPFWGRLAQFTGNHLWNLNEDPGEMKNLAGTPLEHVYARKLAAALKAIDAPDDQVVRLGLEN